MNDSFNSIAKFLFEAGMLTKFKRSGFDFLGTGNQNIASHVFRTAIIGYLLASKCSADIGKTVILCLFHDLPETRTGDINMYQRKYIIKDEQQAANDMFKDLPNPDECNMFIKEFNEGTSLEAVLARDADILELIFTLKEELDIGNKQAEFWIDKAVKRLETDTAINIAIAAKSQNFYDWWRSQD